MTKAEAQQKAKEVRRQMKNPDEWEIEVWNNIGWHWKLYTEYVSLFPSTPTPTGEYHCMIGYGGTGLGVITPQAMCDKDPNKALEKAVSKARELWNKHVEYHETPLTDAEFLVNGGIVKC